MMKKFLLRCANAKKGLSADIFKWIFGVIAGAIVLVFLVRFAFQHISLTEEVNERQVAEYIDDQLEAFSVAESSSKMLGELGDISILVSCQGFGANSYIKRSNKLVFGPSELSGEIAVWTESWDFPFPVANAYYFGDKNMRLLFVYSDESANYVKNLMIPALFRVQRMHIRDFRLERLAQESSTERVNIVFFGPVTDAQSILRKVRRAHVIGVNLHTQEIIYYNNGDSSYYLGDAMLYGAFFGPEYYSCIQEKALEKLRLVAELHLKKVDMIQRKATTSTCQNGLFEARKLLATLASSGEKAQIYQYKDEIEEQNRYLRSNDCATIY